MSRLCLEAQECMIAGRWLDLASLMLTSADVIFSKASEKGLFRTILLIFDVALLSVLFFLYNVSSFLIL